jgi:enterochelin esterase-like enzyme
MQRETLGISAFFIASQLFAQLPGAGPTPPQFTSPEVTVERHVMFRIFAPHAQTVSVFSTDLFGLTLRHDTAKRVDGVWELDAGPLDPGAYRYNFNVDGVAVMDPRNPSVSESNGNAWSLVYLPGADFMDTKELPHGAVASVTYYSKSLGKFRRMHVYTPPGYETGTQKYPIFYLLHGAFDSDDSWTSVGRAGFIIDNLIADNKAKPMVIVMPAGHTESFNLARTPGTPRALDTDDFVKDFVNDIMPYSEAHYRILRDRQHRAIAGLSMGGAQTLNIAIPHSDEFAYVGVFSSGIFGIIAPPAPPAGQANPGPTWEQQHLAELDNAAAKKGLKLFWFSTGKDDFLLTTSKATVELFQKHGYHPVFQESAGAHTWTNWREYLNQFAPQLFE